MDDQICYGVRPRTLEWLSCDNGGRGEGILEKEN